MERAQRADTLKCLRDQPPQTLSRHAAVAYLFLVRRFYAHPLTMTSAPLVPVTRTAEEVGLGFDSAGAPVALTQEAWDLCVAWTDADSERQTYQEQDARLWDVLSVCGSTLQLSYLNFIRTSEHKFRVLCVPRDGTSTEAVRAFFVARADLSTGWLIIHLIRCEPKEPE